MKNNIYFTLKPVDQAYVNFSEEEYELLKPYQVAGYNAYERNFSVPVSILKQLSDTSFYLLLNNLLDAAYVEGRCGICRR